MAVRPRMTMLVKLTGFPTMKAISLILAALCVCVPADAKSKHGKRPPANVAGKFDYYVMSLSWSPSFCESHPDNPQCDRQLGFVLHGLWPQYQSGGYPQHCATREQITEEARTFGVTVFPTAELMEHEWQTHGTCDGRSALEYFKSAANAHASVNVPPQLEPGTNDAKMTAQQIAELLRQATPAIAAQGLAVTCAHREFTEIRVCLSKDLAPRACGKKVNSSCGTGSVKVPGVR